jgi:hypothetical protein
LGWPPYRQVRGKTSSAFDDLGERSLKNIDRPVRLYAVRTASFSTEATAKSPAGAEKPPPLPDKPSIAVLPFQNMSGDPEREYFVDGIAEDLLKTLSKIQELLVIARNSSFVFRGRARDIREIGRMLGARYVLEVSFLKTILCNLHAKTRKLWKAFCRVAASRSNIPVDQIQQPDRCCTSRARRDAPLHSLRFSGMQT